ncbi:MAG TPA: hypothetical protein VHA33_05890 [Candidatus Angelobacter sp.]|jgi:hypothetical protein|nr:hypothetical protein [Candidatus Angelobacter sp.]
MKSPTEVRVRTISTRVTEEEWQTLESLWTSCGLTRGEWCRQVLLSQAGASSAADSESDIVLLLAEVLASRTILINLLHALGRGDSLSAEQVRSLTERADGEKLRRALDRLQQFRQHELSKAER